MQSEDSIVSRTFERSDESIKVEIFAPHPFPNPDYDYDPDNPSWKCRYRIQYPEGRISNRGAVGVDSMQAFVLAMTAVKNDFLSSYKKITWLGQTDLGLEIETYD